MQLNGTYVQYIGKCQDPASPAALDAALDALSARAAEAHAVFGATLSVVGYTLGEVNALRGSGSFIDGVLEDGIVIDGVAPYEWGDLVEGGPDGDGRTVTARRA